MQAGRYVKYWGVDTNSLGKKVSNINMKNTSFLLIKENNHIWLRVFISTIGDVTKHLNVSNNIQHKPFDITRDKAVLDDWEIVQIRVHTLANGNFQNTSPTSCYHDHWNFQHLLCSPWGQSRWPWCWQHQRNNIMRCSIAFSCPFRLSMVSFECGLNMNFYVSVHSIRH